MKHFSQLVALKACTVLFVLLFAASAKGQDIEDGGDEYQINTLFSPGRISTGGYGAITNKFTFIDGHFANLAGVYGGVYLNHSLFVGASAAVSATDGPTRRKG